MIIANTATDAIKKGFAYIKEHGVERERWGGTIPAKLGVGAPQNFDRLMLEVPAFTLELRNPRARWTNIGNNAFITLAETEDHLAGRNPGILVKYSKLYREWQGEDGFFPYTYGDRLLDRRRFPIYEWGAPVGTKPYYKESNGHDQIEWAVQHLLKHPNSRKCVLTISNPVVDHSIVNPPCNIAFQLEIIDGKLNWTTFNRSQDLINGLSENIFMFTLWQEEVLRRLNSHPERPQDYKVEMGVYRVLSSNCHLYQKHMDMDLSRYKEPYHYWSRDAAPKTAMPVDTFDHMNNLLGLGSNPNESSWIPINHYLKEHITDPWWRAWKAALVAEWAIIQGRKAEALDALELAAPAPWVAPVARRLFEKFRGPEEWGLSNPPTLLRCGQFTGKEVEKIEQLIPKAFHGLVFGGGYSTAERVR